MSTTQLDLDEVPMLEIRLRLLGMPGDETPEAYTVTRGFSTPTQAELAALQTLRAVARVLDKAAKKGGRP